MNQQNSIPHAVMDILEPGRNIGYGKEPIPNSRDSDIGALLQRIVQHRQPAILHKQLNDGHQAVLRVFAERQATRAVRTKDQEALYLALVALTLSGLGSASRESLSILPLQLHAAEEIKVDVVQLFELVRRVVGDRLARPLFDFLNRDEADRSIASWDIRSGQMPTAFAMSVIGSCVSSPTAPHAAC